MKTILVLGYLLLMLIFLSFKLSDDVSNNYSVAKTISKRTLSAAGMTVEAIGEENIPKTSGVVIISNHKSVFDALALIATVERAMGFVAAKEMYAPFLRQYIKAIGSVSIDRFINSTMDKRDIIRTQKKIADMLLEGHCLAIFPEGRLIYGEELGEFSAASFKTPQMTDAYIVPTYIHGTEEIITKRKWFRVPKTHITVTFAKAIKPSESGAANTAELCRLTKNIIQEQKDLSAHEKVG
ncbi:MAG: 1-acyl-sn-glycerol-3-phosphate acyltransferase [Oscillospiraceae bacterium]|nr:1-acyl-sn-glycerol-3-phosphate acyltransferase [Oscillospiraceae bacterium]